MFPRSWIVKSLKLWNLLLTRVSLAFGHHETAYLRALSKLRERTPAELAVVFLCTGNICRSPYAERRLLQLLSEKDLSLKAVSSYGLETDSGKVADPTASRLSAELGVDMSSHRTKPVSPEVLTAADLIVVMEPLHLLRLSQLGKEHRAKALLLGSLLAPEILNPQIADPFGRDDAHYRSSLSLIDSGLNRLIERLFGK